MCLSSPPIRVHRRASAVPSHSSLNLRNLRIPPPLPLPSRGAAPPPIRVHRRASAVTEPFLLPSPRGASRGPICAICVICGLQCASPLLPSASIAVHRRSASPHMCNPPPRLRARAIPPVSCIAKSQQSPCLFPQTLDKWGFRDTMNTGGRRVPFLLPSCIALRRGAGACLLPDS